VKTRSNRVSVLKIVSFHHDQNIIAYEDWWRVTGCRHRPVGISPSSSRI
jgi:hypothetical protein